MTTSPLTHQVPTHLGVEDHLLLGLTGKQVMRLLAGGSLAYALWDGNPDATLAIRAGLTALCLLVTLAFALVRPSHRPLEEWAFVAVRYASLPKQTVWRSTPPPTQGYPDQGGDWADFASVAAERGSEALR